MIVFLAKDKLRKALLWLGLPITENLKYDYYTHKVIKDVMSGGGVAIDVGCHKGEVLDEIIRNAPNDKHYGFEPIPALFKKLVANYASKGHHIFPYALAESAGSATFKLVKNAPAYSGLKERKYDIANPEIEEIVVQCMTLDEVVAHVSNIKLIKIDVEGAELGVLRGGRKTVERCRPIILFEFGLGASDVYGTTTEMIFSYFDNLNYALFPLIQYGSIDALDLASLKDWYSNKGAYFFVARPK